ncbi:Putative methyltransferase DDB_G0268948 [Talaromyces islandicus]|uniref:Putative methyltransferase DDB_G0268948 n=1 Tax=Talaromyces islandicus TaxID=28573 RepID=A0A0U1LYN0_TALIS|nr:Putative methyltransferase DDB_G0268948 [Talaromyces islandicus]
MASTPAPQQDKTFRNLHVNQAVNYAATRKGYPPALIKYIVDHHCATGGETKLLLDVGCGPGNSTQDLAPYFDQVFGADPGEGMINAAKELGGVSGAGDQIKYQICSAEELDRLEEPKRGSVDMINVTAAIHWFDIPKFWASAAQMLKPGGTISVWNIFATNPSTPNANNVKVQEIMDHFSNVVVGPYVTPRNKLATSGYRGLNLPWDQAETASCFEKNSLLEKRWYSTEPEGRETGFFGGLAQDEWPLTAVKAMLGTMSPVIRWREAHPDLAGTDQDCVEVVIRQLCEAIGASNALEDGTTMAGGTQVSHTEPSTNAAGTETEEMMRESIRPRSQPCYIKWFAFKERGWMSGHQKSEELSTPRYPEIPQHRDLVYHLKRPRLLENSLATNDILMTDGGVYETRESGASDRRPHGNNGNEDIATLRPRKRLRFSEPLDRPSSMYETAGYDVTGDDDDKENSCPTAKPLINNVVYDDRRKRKPLGIHKPVGYLDFFSKVNASNSSPKQRINTQWKVLDDRVSRTLRQFRGYHRKQSDWEYEI